MFKKAETSACRLPSLGAVHHLIVLLLLLGVARAEPEFVGVLSSAESGKLFVVIPTPGESARWVRIGDEMDGYLVAASRDNDELLILTKQNHDTVLRRKGSRIQHADYRGGLMPLAAAKQLIGSLPGWHTDVAYSVFRRKDGVLLLQAARRLGKAIQVRFIPLTTENAPSSAK